jgi:hypothetical protein
MEDNKEEGKRQNERKIVNPLYDIFDINFCSLSLLHAFTSIFMKNSKFNFFNSTFRLLGIFHLQILMTEKDKAKLVSTEKRKAAEETEDLKKDLKKVGKAKKNV